VVTIELKNRILNMSPDGMKLLNLYSISECHDVRILLLLLLLLPLLLLLLLTLPLLVLMPLLYRCRPSISLARRSRSPPTSTARVASASR